MAKKRVYQSSLILIGLILGTLVTIVFFAMVKAALSPWKPVVNPSPRTWSALGTSATHSCGISNGTIYCWGNGNTGRLGEGSSSGFTVTPRVVQGSIAGKTVTGLGMGTYHTCAFTNESTDNLYCWGYNAYGQLGTGNTTDQTTSIKVAGALAGKTVKAVSANEGQTCAVTTEALTNVYCWGYGGNGRIGDNNAAAHNVLTPWNVNTGSLAGRTMDRLSVGSGHVCALGTAGYLHCWGWNGAGQIGNNTTTDVLVPIQVNTGSINNKTMTRIATGAQHTCVITSDTNVHCWGWNSSGQLGNNSTANSWIPVANGLGSSQELVAGSITTCLLSNGTTWCWGGNSSGQVGNLSLTNSLSGTNIYNNGVLNGKVATVLAQPSPASDSYCVITTDQAGACWGANAYGQLGNGRIAYDGVPNVPTLLNPAISTVTGGSGFNCAVVSARVYCWGDNTYGQLGTGDNISSNTPRPVSMANGALSQQVIDISATSESVCALRQDSTVVCWGRNNVGQLGNGNTTNLNVPSTVTAGADVIAIKSGHTYACAITRAATNNLWCWGENYWYSLGPGFTGGSYSTTAFNNTAGTLSGRRVSGLSPGIAADCAATTDGNVSCWGNNDNGQLGNGTQTSNGTPALVPLTGAMNGLTFYPIISSGWEHICAVASNKKLYCWGINNTGQLGINSAAANALVPTAVYTGGPLGTADIAQVVTAQDYTCARTTAGKAYCWGKNTYGQLGNGDSFGYTATAPNPVYDQTILTGVSLTYISAGIQGATTCSTNGIYIYCWGSGSYGQNGDGFNSNNLIPDYVKLQIPLSNTGYRFYNNANSLNPGTPLAATNTAATLPAKQAFRLRTDVAARSTAADSIKTLVNHGQFTCVINSTDQVYCWGRGDLGQLGNGSTVFSSTPVAVSQGAMPAGAIKTIAAGFHNACAIASDNKAYCWGYNATGELGNNSTTNSPVPVAVSQGAMPAGATIQSISAGDFFTCAIASDNKAYCWGYNPDGRIGNGAGSSSVPVAVSQGAMPVGAIKSISAGGAHACAIASDNKAYCWGSNQYGQLGNNNAPTNSASPVAVSQGAMPAGTTLKSIYTGGAHTCAVASDNKVYCWGLNNNGQLGNNSTTNSPVPVAVSQGAMPSTSITSLSIDGGNTPCAVASDNKVYCWGYNSDGRVGDGTTNNALTPVAVSQGAMPAGATIQSVSSGGYHACVIASDNLTYCWGINDAGQLGTSASTIWRSLTPLKMTFAYGQLLNSYLDNVFKLQFAQKSTATTCSNVTGFADITTTSEIAWNTNSSVTNSTAITTTPNDPTPSAATTPQTYKSDTGIYIAADVPSGNSALWDFSLKDNTAPANTTYCFRIVYTDSSGTPATPLEFYTVYPELTTAGDLSVSIVDGSGAAVTSPSFPLSSTVVQTKCQTTTGTFGTDAQRIRLMNPRATNWSVVAAAAAGATAKWDSGSAAYDFNDPSGSPPGCNSGPDGDGIAGQLSVDPTISTIAPQSGCGTTGISKGSSSAFNQGTIDNITLLTSSSSGLGCYWDMTGIGLSQQIPSAQPAGSYILNVRVTATAS